MVWFIKFNEREKNIMFHLYEYTGYPIDKTCMKIADHESACYLMDLTIGKGDKFFINSSFGGTYYSKDLLTEKWDCLNYAFPIKGRTK